MRVEVCPALGHKRYIPLLIQIMGAYALSNYAPAEIRNSMLLTNEKSVTGA